MEIVSSRVLKPIVPFENAPDLERRRVQSSAAIRPGSTDLSYLALEPALSQKKVERKTMCSLSILPH